METNAAKSLENAPVVLRLLPTAAAQLEIGAMMQMGADRIMFATDYPFEEIPDACIWFDNLQISEPDKKKIARDTAIDLFKLDL